MASGVLRGNAGEAVPPFPKIFVRGTPFPHLLSGHGGTLIPPYRPARK